MKDRIRTLSGSQLRRNACGHERKSGAGMVPRCAGAGTQHIERRT